MPSSLRAKRSNPVLRASGPGLLRRGACHRAGHFGPDPSAPRNDDAENRSRDASAPELCQPQRHEMIRPRHKKGGEAPTGALSYQSPLARRRALSPPSSFAGRVGRGAPAYRRFTAALATGSYPDGSAPEPGFPTSQARRCFARSHSSRRLSTLRADRSFCRSTGAPEPPECGLAIPPAGTATRSAFQACRPDKRPIDERDVAYVTDIVTMSRAVSATVTTTYRGGQVNA